MNEQRIREIAETAFKRQFPDVKLARVNVWPGVGFEDDSPVVDVHIIYDGKYEQLNADGLLDAKARSSIRRITMWRTTSASPASTSSPNPSLGGATWRRCDRRWNAR